MHRHPPQPARPAPAAALLLVLALPLAAAEPPSGRVVLVLDASGSMWGRIGEQTKIEIARQVVRELVEDWKPGVHLGLTAYGHRREGDCGDIEAVIPPGAVDPARVIATVDAINPKGKTPLSDAVIHAARQLRYEEGKATVILVSDGEETCGRDPCRVGRELEAAGADFTAHIIGFDVDSETAIAQLRCLAETTGGEFTLARDAAALREALGRAVRSTWIRLRAPEIVFSGEEFEVEWSGPDGAGDRIAIVPAEAPAGTSTTSAATALGSPARLRGPDTLGPHEVRYVSGPEGSTLLALQVTVRASAAALEAPATIAAGAELSVDWRGPAAAGDVIALVKASEPDERYLTGDFSAPTSAGSPVRLRVFSEPGAYELRYLATRGARVLARRPIRVTPVGASLDGPGTVEASAPFQVAFSGPGHAGDQIVLVEASMPDNRWLTGPHAAAAEAGSPARLTAFSEPGAYELRYLTGADARVLARQPLTIRAAAVELRAPATIAAGEPIELRWSGPGREGDRIVLVPASARAGSYNTRPQFTQPAAAGSAVRLIAYSDPGAYEIRYMAGTDGTTLASAALTITASTAGIEAPASVAAGEEFEVRWRGPGLPGDRIVLVEAGADEGAYYSSSAYQAAVGDGSPARLQALPSPGRYEVRYLAAGDGGTLARAPLEIR